MSNFRINSHFLGDIGEPLDREQALRYACGEGESRLSTGIQSRNNALSGELASEDVRIVIEAHCPGWDIKCESSNHGAVIAESSTMVQGDVMEVSFMCFVEAQSSMSHSTHSRFARTSSRPRYH